MTTLDELVPASSGRFTKAMAYALSAELDVPIRDLMDPDKTPPRVLPFLAAHRGATLWFDDWPIERKRRLVREWPFLRTIIGLRGAQELFLSFVDGVLVDKISHPTRFVLGRSVLGRTPIGHPAFVARHLVKIVEHRPPRSLVIGRTAFSRAVLRTPSRERIRRGLVALAQSKAPGTEYRADFAHQRVIRVDDAIPFDGTYRLGDFIDRTRL